MRIEIATIAVLGAGTMGRGIAHVSALAGFSTRLFDVAQDAVDKARTSIEKNLDKGVELGKVKAEAAAAAKGALTTHVDLAQAVRDADLVIEAIPETMALKIETFRAVAHAAPAHALFASNTSALSITEMAAASGRPERFAGMHFFNPVHVMKLLELVRGLETSDDTIAALTAVGQRMGKEVVLVREAPGFVTTRINALIGNEAFRMLEQGVAHARNRRRIALEGVGRHRLPRAGHLPMQCSVGGGRSSARSACCTPSSPPAPTRSWSPTAWC